MKIPKRQSGFSLVELMIAMGVMLAVAAGFMTMVSDIGRMNSGLSQKLETLSINNYLLQLMTDSQRCVCQFQGKTFDATDASGAQFIDVDLVMKANPADCTSASTAIFTAGERLSSGLEIDKIQMQQLVPNSVPPTVSWRGRWMVSFKAFKTMSIKPLFLDQLLTINDGASAAATVVSCTNTTAPATICPAGMILVGTSGERSTFCIDNAARGPATFNAAIAACSAVSMPGIGRAHICSYPEWQQGYIDNTALGIRVNREWVNAPNMWNSGDRTMATTNAVAAEGSGSISAAWPHTVQLYRCCL